MSWPGRRRRVATAAPVGSRPSTARLLRRRYLNRSWLLGAGVTNRPAAQPGIIRVVGGHQPRRHPRRDVSSGAHHHSETLSGARCKSAMPSKRCRRVLAARDRGLYSCDRLRCRLSSAVGKWARSARGAPRIGAAQYEGFRTPVGSPRPRAMVVAVPGTKAGSSSANRKSQATASASSRPALALGYKDAVADLT
jgi:hypothetical protein